MTGSPNVYVNDRRVIREGDHPLEEGGEGGGGLLDLLSQLQDLIAQVNSLQSGSATTQTQISSLSSAVSNLTTLVTEAGSASAISERVDDLQQSIETLVQNIGQEAGLLNILTAASMAEYNAAQAATQSESVLAQTQGIYDSVAVLVEGAIDPQLLTDVQAAAAAALAAQVAAEAAATSALNWSNTAATHVTSAATHAGNAASSANSASTYATQSQTYANSAIAASNSATLAVTTAQSHRDTAATHANNAANSATAAATSASSALTYLTDTISYSASALSSSVTANLSRDDAVKAAGNTDFRYGTTNWTLTPGGSFTHETNISASGGKVIESNPGSAVTILSDTTYPVPNLASVMTITAKIRQTVNGSFDAGGIVFVGFACYDVTGAYLGDRWAATGGSGHTLVNADGWHTYTANITGSGAGQNNYFATTTQVKLKAILNQSAVPLVEQQIDYMYVQDATLATQAANSASAAATSASSAASSQTAAGNSATASQTSATQAASSAAAVGTAATTAAANASQAGVYATNAATSATNAATSASQAATSVTTAANSATAAGTSANAAATSATNAQTYATQSQSYSTAADTSATNAATSSSNAATQATNAANSATAASGSAASANTYANNASTSATNAAGSASTATTQAGLASTSATNAGNSASAAASSATTASTAATDAGVYATNASTQALNAATSYNNIIMYGGNPYFADDLIGWSGLVGGTGSPAFTIQSVSDATAGKVARSNTGAQRDLFSTRFIPVDITKRYRLRVKYRTSSGATVAAKYYFGFAGFDATGTVVNHAPNGSYRYAGAAGVTKTQNDGWNVIDALISGVGNDAVTKFPPGTTQIRLVALTNYDDAAVTTDIDYFYIVDSELAEQAAGFASAASVSATQSATSATNAAGSASQASTSQTLAAGSATTAGTSATNAGNSATAAAGSAGTAATHASNASISATAAATSATTAAGSATTATTQQGLATTAATNAANSATAASSSAASASVHASNAATSATNAAGSASSAATSAGLSVSSATSSAASATDTANLANTLLYKEGEFNFQEGAKAWGVGYTTATSPLTEPLLMPGINNTTVTSVSGSQFSKNKGLGVTADIRVFHKHYYAIDTTKRYAFKYRFRKTVNSSVGTSTTAIGLIHYDTTKSYLSANANILAATNYTVANGWVDGEIVLVGENAAPTNVNKTFKTGTKYVRMYFDANTTGGNATYEWDTLSFEYVELVEQARDQAGIATTNAAAASVSASNAATSATSATNSASTASTQAGLATSAATTATTQAGIATTQASNASISATNAASSATSATASASTASTQAGISTSAATTATTQAGNASTSASNAAISAALASATTILMFPADFTVNKDAWTQTPTGASNSGTTTTKNIVTNPTLGPCLEFSGIGANLWSKGLLPATVGKIYEIEVTGIYTVNTTDGTGNIALYMAGLDAAFNTPVYAGLGFSSGMNVAGGKFTISSRWSDVANATYYIRAWTAGKVWLRPYVLVNNGEAGSPVVHIQSIRVRDVTEALKALIQADLAAASATTATTQAANASTYATQAATSATNASNSASTASTQAGISTSAATTATTQATNAANSATTATTQAAAAAVSATSAATSATNASNSASTASTQAGISTTAATTATTQATNAANSATAAQAALTSANAAALNIFPPDFTVNKESWTDAFTGSPTSVATTTKSIVADATLGQSLELSGIGALVLSKNVLAATVGRIYEIEVTGIATVNPTDANGNLGIYVWGLDTAYATAVLAGPVVATTITVAGGKFTYKARFGSVVDATYGVTAWPAGKVWLRPYIVANTGEAGSPAMRLQSIRVRDVTEVVNAEKQVALATTQATNAAASATTATTQAANASISATQAATSATNANTSAGTASTQAGVATSAATTATTQAGTATTQAANASTSATNAASSATTAGTAAAAASSSATVAARVSSGTTMNANPLFANWASTYPDQWTLWVATGGTIVKNTANSRYGPNCIEMDSTSAANLGIYIGGSGNMVPIKTTHYVLDVEVELVSGASINGAGINLFFIGTPGNQSVNFPFNTEATVAGSTYILRKVIAANASVLAMTTLTDIQMYAITNHVGQGTLTIKKLRWHKCSIRPASTEEIRTYNVATEITAAVTTEANARATADGVIEGKYGVKVDVNGYVSGFGLISTANNAAPTSTFTVLADNFKVVKPGGAGNSATPKQMFSVGNAGGVTTIVMNGDVVADGSLTAGKLNVSALSAVTANLGEVTAGIARSSDSKMIINFDLKKIIMSDNS